MNEADNNQQKKGVTFYFSSPEVKIIKKLANQIKLKPGKNES